MAIQSKQQKKKKTTKKNTTKKKVTISVSQKAKVVKKGEDKKDALRCDTLKKAPFIINDNGLNMRIKIKRKSR